jgi:hypothetical protein
MSFLWNFLSANGDTSPALNCINTAYSILILLIFFTTTMSSFPSVKLALGAMRKLLPNWLLFAMLIKKASVLIIESLSVILNG